ncbi:MAG TPA: hypothetical protein VFA65_21660 [Bryobacteraceae bacterium]|nr:hypothetical protein [Bryobacteraceae bacterium]
MNNVGHLGRILFSLAIVALGVETIICAQAVTHGLGARYSVIPVLPWLPSVSWLAYLFGAIWILCAIGLLSRRTLQTASVWLAILLLLCTLILDVPKNAVDIRNIGLRTIVFEPLSLACIAWLLQGWSATPGWATKLSRYLLAISLIVFGVDHFLAIIFIANLLPAWIPWHVFWVVFFGGAFIAAGISIALNVFERWGAFCLGLMFGIWVVTLHLPRVLGLYGIPGAPHNPDEWSSLFIAVALWGGLWALTQNRRFLFD